MRVYVHIIFLILYSKQAPPQHIDVQHDVFFIWDFLQLFRFHQHIFIRVLTTCRQFCAMTAEVSPEYKVAEVACGST